MTEKEKTAGALGLCRRAGKTVSGVYSVKEALIKGKAALVILSSDAAKNTENSICPLAAKKGIPVHRAPLSKKEMGAALGENRDVVCISVPKEFVNLVLASL